MGFSPGEVATYENAVWSRCAKGYMDGFRGLTGEAVPALLDAAEVKNGDCVLDVGCGPGLATTAAIERGASAIGVDFSEAMVDEARHRNPGVEFRVADAHSLPFGDGSFDGVVSNLTLHHLGDPDRFLAEASRILRPGGRLAFTVWADMPKLEAFGLFFGAVEEHGDPGDLPHGPLFGMSDFAVFRSMVEKAGFHDPNVQEVNISWQMASIDSLLAAFRDWANMDTFPPEVADAITATVRERSKAYESRSGLLIPNPVILVSAAK
jgi:SAM-dependent methyltransferase